MYMSTLTMYPVVFCRVFKAPICTCMTSQIFPLVIMDLLKPCHVHIYTHPVGVCRAPVCTCTYIASQMYLVEIMDFLKPLCVHLYNHDVLSGVCRVCRAALHTGQLSLCTQWGLQSFHSSMVYMHVLTNVPNEDYVFPKAPICIWLHSLCSQWGLCRS